MVETERGQGFETGGGVSMSNLSPDQQRAAQAGTHTIMQMCLRLDGESEEEENKHSFFTVLAQDSISSISTHVKTGKRQKFKLDV